MLLCQHTKSLHSSISNLCSRWCCCSFACAHTFIPTHLRGSTHTRRGQQTHTQHQHRRGDTMRAAQGRAAQARPGQHNAGVVWLGVWCWRLTCLCCVCSVFVPCGGVCVRLASAARSGSALASVSVCLRGCRWHASAWDSTCSSSRKTNSSPMLRPPFAPLHLERSPHVASTHSSLHTLLNAACERGMSKEGGTTSSKIRQ